MAPWLFAFWIGCGLLGQAVLAVRQATPWRVWLLVSLRLLPIAMLMGPVWLGFMLTTPNRMNCPNCENRIPLRSDICPFCAREVERP